MIVRRMTAVVMLLLMASGPAQGARRGGRPAPVPKAEHPESARVGRYHLVPVEFTVHDLVNGTTSTKRELVLLDTVTGQMQACSQKILPAITGGKEIAERRCLPFETYAEYPAGTHAAGKKKNGEVSSP